MYEQQCQLLLQLLSEYQQRLQQQVQAAPHASIAAQSHAALERATSITSSCCDIVVQQSSTSCLEGKHMWLLL